MDDADHQQEIEENEPEGSLDLAEEISKDEVAVGPSDTADPQAIIDAKKSLRKFAIGTKSIAIAMQPRF